MPPRDFYLLSCLLLRAGLRRLFVSGAVVSFLFAAGFRTAGIRRGV